MKVLALLILLSTTAYAEYQLVPSSSLQSQHDWEHFGLSYAIFMTSYGISNQAFKFSPQDARIFSFMATFMATSLYGMGAGGPGAPLLNTHDVTINMLGAATAALTTHVFKFGQPNESIADYEKRIGKTK